MFTQLRTWLKGARERVVDKVAAVTRRPGDCGHSMNEIGRTAVFCGRCRQRGFDRSMRAFGAWPSTEWDGVGDWRSSRDF